MTIQAQCVSRVDVSNLPPEAFRERYQYLGLPVVITGLLHDEQVWDLDYLCKHLGDCMVALRYYGRDRYNQDKRQWKSAGSGVALKSLKFADYAEMLRSHYAHEHQIYLGKFSLKNTSIAAHPTLQALGDRLGLVPATDFQLYMGHRGHRSGLHYDVMDGTIVQLYGEKQVILFPPSQTQNLYPYSVFVHLRHGSRLRCWHSQVAPETLDLQVFPKVKQALASQQEVILKPGEILYIPAGWWHDVTTLGDEMACSVSRFWRIYPTSRAVFCWNRWRSVAGNLLRVPHLLTELAAIPFQQDSKQKFHEFLHRI